MDRNDTPISDFCSVYTYTRMLLSPTIFSWQLFSVDFQEHDMQTHT
jgi:hypothetical protein